MLQALLLKSIEFAGFFEINISGFFNMTTFRANIMNRGVFRIQSNIKGRAFCVK